jgi:hypothetical protein
MLSIRGVSDKPCFICNAREKTVDVAFGDKTFRGVLCLTHVYDKLKPESGKTQEKPSGKPAGT